MTEKSKTPQPSGRRPTEGAQRISEGYPLYPASEDVYNQHRIEPGIDPEDITRVKEPSEPARIGLGNEKEFLDDISGGDLDVPGSEMDDEQEIVGNEDEENNFYSLGGDGHSDLDEDKGV